MDISDKRFFFTFNIFAKNEKNYRICAKSKTFVIESKIFNVLYLNNKMIVLKYLFENGYMYQTFLKLLYILKLKVKDILYQYIQRECMEAKNGI